MANPFQYQSNQIHFICWACRNAIAQIKPNETRDTKKSLISRQEPIVNVKHNINQSFYTTFWHLTHSTYSVLWFSIPESKWLQRVVGGLEPNHRFTMVMNHLSFCTNVHGGGRVCSRSFFFLFAPYFPTLLWEIDNMFILKYSLAFFRFSFCMSTLCSSSAAAKVLEFRAECAACWTLFGPFHQVSQWNGSQYAKNACDWL